MRRWLVSALAVVVLVAAAVAILSYVQEEPVRTELVLAEIDGEVAVFGGDGKPEVARAGAALDPKDRVTTGLASRAVLAVGDTSRIRLGPESSVEVVAHDDNAVTLELEGGSLQATVRAGPTALRVQSEGREVVATDATFEMGVGDDGTLVVEVTDGAAATVGIPGIPEVHAGERATVAADGEGVLGAVTPELLLAVSWPEVRKTRERVTRVTGTTAPGATVVVRGGERVVQVKADRTGAFVAEVPLTEGGNPLSVEASDPLGKVAVDDDGVVVELKTRGATIEKGFIGGSPP